MSKDDKEPVYILQRSIPKPSETHIKIWIKDEGMKLSSYEISKLLADVLQSQIKSKGKS